MLPGLFHVAPAVHGPVGNTFEHHDLARTSDGESGEDEIFSDTRNQIEGNSGEMLAGKDIFDVSQGERAHGGGERRMRGIGLEEASHLALAGSDDYQVMGCSVFVQFL